MPSETPSRLSELVVAPGDGPAASLVSALTAAIVLTGRPCDRHAVAVVTGIAFHTSYCREAAPGCRWNTHGLDAFLIEGALRWGLELREMHPPDAAPLPTPPPEYDGHFRDSYMPFVEAALSRGQPVLAWMGWPAPAERAWGVMTGMDATAGRCRGSTAMSGPWQVVMDSPPVAIYTIAGTTEPAHEPGALFRQVAGQARCLLAGEIDTCHGIETGIRVLERLAARVGESGRLAEDGAAGLVRVLQDKLAGCESAIAWLRGAGPSPGAPQGEIAEAWCADCERQRELARACLEEFPSAGTAAALRGIIEIDTRIAEMLPSWNS